MKAVVAIDSFKGSMTSMQAGNAAKRGILAAHPEAEVVVCPVADGGEGTTDALIEGLGGEKIELAVSGPLGDVVKAYYGWLPERKTAVMEMASAAGITLVKKKDPLRASTRGVGEMIADALARGCRDFIIGIGGSATNDGGIGMLKALGYTFTDENGADVGEGAQALGRVERICADQRTPLLEGVRFQIACDVTNPLCGENGATYIFGPQKGVTEEQKQPIDEAMRHYAKVAEQYFRCSTAKAAGAGAAGGLGFAFLTFLSGTLIPGVTLVLEVTGLEKELQDADFAVTGEGRLDAQSVMGKAPVGVAKLAKKYGVKTIAFAGSVARDAGCCNASGIDAFFPIVRGVTTLEAAMETETAEQNMAAAAEQVFRLLTIASRLN
ncbi:MAG: glycerate kinase [Lachnospiraceae bacterium]|nr:glycerate kinase [Lachnospiraceae bacterium]